MRALGLAACLPLIGLGACVETRGGPAQVVTRVDQLPAAVSRCWIAPSSAAGAKVQVMTRFDREGRLAGEPPIVEMKPHDRTVEADLVASIERALAECSPVPVSPEIGERIARQDVLIQFDVGVPAR
jgi:hypothetical protein